MIKCWCLVPRMANSFSSCCLRQTDQWRERYDRCVNRDIDCHLLSMPLPSILHDCVNLRSVEHTYPTLASCHSQLHGLASRTSGANTSTSAVPVLDPRYGHLGNKSLGTRLRMAENGVHTRDFSSLVRQQTGKLNLSSTHNLKSTDAMCFCQV